MIQFLQPALLWGTLAVAVPVALHFWHQKRGQPLPWATLRWLADSNQQPNRGLQFDNWLLLLLRCAVLLALAGLLAQPVFTETTAKPTVKKIHLIEPTTLITSNFRFELETALKQGEPVFWINQTPTPVTTLTPLPTTAPVTHPLLQSAINHLNRPDNELHLYLTNRQTLADRPSIVVPKRFRLHTAMPTPKPSQPLPRYTRPISVQLSYQNPAERHVVQAGLQALADVYGFVFTERTAVTVNQEPDLVFSDITPKNPAASTLYIVSQKNGHSTHSNIIYWPDTLTLATSELVANGLFPEWLGGKISLHLGLITNDLPMSSAQLNALFIRAGTDLNQLAPQQGQTLWLLGLLSLILAERWLSFRKNA